MTAKWFLTERHLGLRPIWLEQGGWGEEEGENRMWSGLVNILIHKLVVNLFK